jgi:hypothetical protein
MITNEFPLGNISLDTRNGIPHGLNTITRVENPYYAEEDLEVSEEPEGEDAF